MKINELSRFWADPVYREQVASETKRQREFINQRWDADMIIAGNRWPTHWTDAEKNDATGQLKEFWEGYEEYINEKEKGDE